jgi:DNA-binding transcriptional regulator YhcF (GntR family)
LFSQNQYDTSVPLYLQIIMLIKQNIVTGTWQPSQRMPPVRDLAMEFGVNPNTMQRSLAALERDGLVHSERTAGRYITGDTARIETERNAMAQDIIRDFQEKMNRLGYTDKELVLLLQHLSSTPPMREEGEESL